jgi:hypothetical protein
MKSQYKVKTQYSPLLRTRNTNTKIDLDDVLLRFCHHDGEYICMECKQCKKQSPLSFTMDYKNIKKIFRKIPHTCKKYRAPLRSGQPLTIKKRTRMRNRIKKLFRRRR